MGRVSSPSGDGWNSRHGGRHGRAIAARRLSSSPGLISLQLLAAGYSLTLADGAAESGALALASGHPARRRREARRAGSGRTRTRVSVSGGEVIVRLRPPSPFSGLADRLAVSSSARVEAAIDGGGPKEGFGVAEAPKSFPVVVVTRVGVASGSRAAAAALACAGSEPDRAGAADRPRRGSRARAPRCSPPRPARALEERLAAHLPEAARRLARAAPAI